MMARAESYGRLRRGDRYRGPSAPAALRPPLRMTGRWQGWASRG